MDLHDAYNPAFAVRDSMRTPFGLAGACRKKSRGWFVAVDVGLGGGMNQGCALGGCFRTAANGSGGCAKRRCEARDPRSTHGG